MSGQTGINRQFSQPHAATILRSPYRLEAAGLRRIGDPKQIQRNLRCMDELQAQGPVNPEDKYSLRSDDPRLKHLNESTITHIPQKTTYPQASTSVIPDPLLIPSSVRQHQVRPLTPRNSNNQFSLLRSELVSSKSFKSSSFFSPASRQSQSGSNMDPNQPAANAAISQQSAELWVHNQGNHHRSENPQSLSKICNLQQPLLKTFTGSSFDNPDSMISSSTRSYTLTLQQQSSVSSKVLKPSIEQPTTSQQPQMSTSAFSGPSTFSTDTAPLPSFFLSFPSKWHANQITLQGEEISENQNYGSQDGPLVNVNSKNDFRVQNCSNAHTGRSGQSQPDLANRFGNYEPDIDQICDIDIDPRLEDDLRSIEGELRTILEVCGKETDLTRPTENYQNINQDNFETTDRNGYMDCSESVELTGQKDNGEFIQISKSSMNREYIYDNTLNVVNYVTDTKEKSGTIKVTEEQSNTRRQSVLSTFTTLNLSPSTFDQSGLGTNVNEEREEKETSTQEEERGIYVEAKKVVRGGRNRGRPVAANKKTGNKRLEDLLKNRISSLRYREKMKGEKKNLESDLKLLEKKNLELNNSARKLKTYYYKMITALLSRSDSH